MSSRTALGGILVAIVVAALAPSSALAGICTGQNCGVIDGTINGPAGDGGVSVYAYVYDAGGNYLEDAAPGYSNNYSTGPLTPGTYLVCFVPQTGKDWYVQQCYNGQPSSPFGATAVGVQANTTTWNINATMVQGGNIKGNVTDATTGAPITNFAITVAGAPSQICEDGTTSCSAGHANGAGGYSTSTLAPGGYGLQFSAPGYKSESVAGNITALTTATINVAMEPAGSGGGGGGGGSGGAGGGAGGGGGAGSGGGAGGGANPTAAQIITQLKLDIAPSGKASAIGALLKAGGCVLTVKALAAGKAIVSWYFVPAGAHVANAHLKPILVARGIRTFGGPESGKLRIRLTAAGRRMLKNAHDLKLTGKATFAPTSGATLSVLRRFNLKR